MSAFPTKILLATDGSEEADLALRMAVNLARSAGSELHVVHVGEASPVYHPERHGYHARQEIRREEARRLLDDQAEEIKAAGGTVAQAHLRIGRPDEEIVALCEELGAGIIVVGSRGLGGVRRALMGSVADSVVRHAPCPVLVIRRQVEDAPRYPDGVGKKPTFWEMLLGDHRSEREQRVLEYVVHRVGDGAHLADVVREEYVRRNASPAEVEDICANPRLVEAARREMNEDFASGELDPRRRP
jgi:nucleotide-binding universal stress UspA family protein